MSPRRFWFTGDDRLWVPSGGPLSGFALFALPFARATGYELAEQSAGGLSVTNRHPQPVSWASLLKGLWHYLDMMDRQGKAATWFEPPCETTTLVVPDDVEEIGHVFQVNAFL